MRYARHISTKRTPQSSPIPGRSQVLNSAGGYVYALDSWAGFRRFLILGSEGNTYYASERELTKANAKAVIECIKADGPRAVREIVDISFSGRAPKNDPAVFALALCMAYGDEDTRRQASEALPKVCRIGTHLFHFADAVNELRGWGKMLRNAVALWYNTKPPRELALQVVKYKQRDGWSHRDLLRLAHAAPVDEMHNSIYNWITSDDANVDGFNGTDAELIWASQEAMNADKPALLSLINDYRLPREVIPTQWLRDPDIWAAMLPSMGLTALTRNLANMTRCGLIEQGNSDMVTEIAGRITSKEQLIKARVHPIQVLSALVTYSSGRGARSRGEAWKPNTSIVDALDQAFYAAFGNVKPTGNRHMLAMDVSGSMTCGEIAGIPGLTPRAASAALAMVTQAVENDTQTVAFASGKGCFKSSTKSLWGGECGIVPIDISRRRRLDDVVKYLNGFPFGGTDCSLPMLYASANKIMVDVFIVYTDNETWAGNIHPVQALQQYREQFSPDAKLIVVGMIANNFSIADPNDTGMLDVVGFDTATPALMADFARGNL